MKLQTAKPGGFCQARGPHWFRSDELSPRQSSERIEGRTNFSRRNWWPTLFSVPYLYLEILPGAGGALIRIVSQTDASDLLSIEAKLAFTYSSIALQIRVLFRV